MSTENKEDLFEIKLTEVGRNYILKTARIAGFSMVLSLIMSAFHLLSSILRITKSSSIETEGAFSLTYQTANILVVISLVFNIIAIIKYYSFVFSLKKSIVKIDEGKFSLSFRLMFGNLIFFLIGLILHIVATILYIFGPLGSQF